MPSIEPADAAALTLSLVKPCIRPRQGGIDAGAADRCPADGRADPHDASTAEIDGKSGGLAQPRRNLRGLAGGCRRQGDDEFVAAHAGGHAVTRQDGAQPAVVIGEQARAGADFSAVVVFHVTNPNPVVAGTPCNIKGRVLAIHGSADPVTPKPMMDAFEEEMTTAAVDWQVVMFGGAVHSFCDPTANAGPSRYDEKLCRQSYRLMRDFFSETF